MANSPHSLTIRMYHVGFGDCFLLTFHYRTLDKNLLIDFGTTRQPKAYMQAVADDIAVQCDGKLDAVVATHRHRDHISGFTLDKDPAKKSSGKTIADLQPDLVSFPWTEDPDLDADAIGPVRDDDNLSFVASLKSMQRLAERAQAVAKAARQARRFRLSNELSVLSDINIANKSALQNLLTMSGNGNQEFLHYGSKTRLDRMFRGVKFHVLGPPTVEQASDVKSQAQRNEDEYWHLANYWQLLETAFLNDGKQAPLFPKRFVRKPPSSAAWLIDKLRDPTPADLLRISRVMDDALNNTSVILVIEACGHKLLFPGDAQFENWNYALNGPDGDKNRELLADVDVYKVGHHASLNGTPKSLWKLFSERKDRPGGKRLTSLLSSRLHIHGHASNGSEVPREKLVRALKRGSRMIATPYDISKQVKFQNVASETLLLTSEPA